MPKKIKIDVSEFNQLIISQLKGIKNIQLIIIKGHILVEYALEQFIDTFSDHAKAIGDTNFGFFQKLQISMILGLSCKDPSDALIGQIDLLNKIRNQIAHTLDYDPLLLKELFKYYSELEEEYELYKEKTKNVKILTNIIAYICGHVVGRAEGKKRSANSVRL